MVLELSEGATTSPLPPVAYSHDLLVFQKYLSKHLCQSTMQVCIYLCNFADLLLSSGMPCSMNKIYSIDILRFSLPMMSHCIINGIVLTMSF